MYKDLGTMAEKMCFACLQQCLPAGGALELNVCWECAMSQYKVSLLPCCHEVFVRVLQEDELGGPAEEMRFALPAAPSPPAQEFLMAGAQEVARGGGCHLSTDALALFVWHLGDAVLSTFRYVSLRSAGLSPLAYSIRECPFQSPRYTAHSKSSLPQLYGS